MKKYMFATLIILMSIMSFGCSEVNSLEYKKDIELSSVISMETYTSIETDKSKSGETMNIQIGDKNFTVVLYDNESSKALLSQMPLTVNMGELNGNEKYYYLQDDLPTKSERVRTVNIGDLMLYGSNCLVLFYKTFSTSYSYTKLGYIENHAGLASALGTGNVKVIFTR